ncbi:hypothetical protein FAGKG844_50110 [Frankia sp. AgKG'84/4]
MTTLPIQTYRTDPHSTAPNTISCPESPISRLTDSRASLSVMADGGTIDGGAADERPPNMASRLALAPREESPGLAVDGTDTRP